MDPATLAALISGIFGIGGSAISALGYHPQQQQFRQSFSGSAATNPINTLSQALSAVNNLEFGIGQQGLPGTPRSFVQTSPAAETNVPGIPFTFGAGRAIDPAVSNPSLLNGLDISQIVNAMKRVPQQQAQGADSNSNSRPGNYY